MKRSKNKAIAPNVWSCIGGKMEANEMNDPLSACFREIEEETGIKRENIHNLRLRYIIFRQKKNIIRQNYIYFGETDKMECKITEEGATHWINENELDKKMYSQTYAEMINHFMQNKSSLNIFTGIAGMENGMLKMNWSVLQDFEN